MDRKPPPISAEQFRREMGMELIEQQRREEERQRLRDRISSVSSASSMKRVSGPG